MKKDYYWAIVDKDGNIQDHPVHLPWDVQEFIYQLGIFNTKKEANEIKRGNFFKKGKVVKVKVKVTE